MARWQERFDGIVAAFERAYGRAPDGVAGAPGRVNLIGEHVDYNDGLVLPFAVEQSVLCAWKQAPAPAGDPEPAEPGVAVERQSGEGAPPAEAASLFELATPQTLPQLVRVYSAEFDAWDAWSRTSPRLDEMLAVRRGDWRDYPAGVLWALRDAGHDVGGVDLAISGDVPQGAGLSSSAAIEVAVAGALRDAFGLDIDGVALARLCQRAENEYAGVQSGIMDQFASALSKRDHALLVDCRTLAYEHVPLRLDRAGLAVVIADSAVSRELASSAYNQRRRECEEAVALLRERLHRDDLASLRDVSSGDLDTVEIDTVPLRRARHVVGEIARVAAAVEALRADDFAALGALMAESHESLRADYEVSSLQLDLLVGLAAAQDYVSGARLTGAGFGGCTVNIVRADAVEAFERDVIAPYGERTGLPARSYVTPPADGLRIARLIP
jgi:galactokinase